jgi:DNA-directed RNA polymerase specialized sigma24 family protein
LFDFNRQLRGVQETVLSDAQELTAVQKQRDIYETHRHRVFSVSYYMTANELEAERILTHTFVEAFAGAPEPDAHGVDEALLTELERRFSLAPTAPARPDKGADLGGGQVRRTDLEEAVGTLPPRERLVFLLRDVESYPAARIAGLLGCDEAGVQMTLLSARIRMRNALSQLRARETVLRPTG